VYIWRAVGGGGGAGDVSERAGVENRHQPKGLACRRGVRAGDVVALWRGVTHRPTRSLSLARALLARRRLLALKRLYTALFGPVMLWRLLCSMRAVHRGCLMTSSHTLRWTSGEFRSPITLEASDLLQF
jgi:hypothetical protein